MPVEAVKVAARADDRARGMFSVAMGFAVRSRGADVYASLTARGSFILGRQFAAYAVALVSEADDELLELLHRQGGKLDNLTGDAVAFIALIDRAEVVGTSRRIDTSVSVDQQTTRQVFELPAKGFTGHRSLTDHVKYGDTRMSDSASFVIDAKRGTQFARAAGISLTRLPCLAVWDRGSDEIVVIDRADWLTMLRILYDAVADYYQQHHGHPFLKLATAADAADGQLALAEFDRLEERVSRRLVSDWPTTGPITVGWVYRRCRSPTDGERFAREVDALLGLTPSGAQHSDRACNYWRMQQLRQRVRRRIKLLRAVTLTARVTADAEQDSKAAIWVEIRGVLGSTDLVVPDGADRETELAALILIELALRAECKQIAARLDERLGLVDRSAFTAMQVEREVPGTSADRANIERQRQEIGERLEATPAPSLTKVVDAAIGRHHKEVRRFRIKTTAGQGSAFVTNLLGAIASVPM